MKKNHFYFSYRFLSEPPRNLEVANSNEVNIVFTHEGSNITLTCTVEQGIPSGNISWYNGNTKLASNTSSIVRYGFHITRNDHKLGLACEASNSFYTARKIIHLHIYSKYTMYIFGHICILTKV